MLKIEMMPVSELLEYSNNAKRHTPEQIAQIKASIEEFGMNDPVAIWKDNTIIEGHGRLMAAKELGMKEVPVMRLDHLTDSQRKQYAIVHNQLTLNSGFDIEVLNKELESITDIDMEKYGLHETEIPTPEFYEGFYMESPAKEKEQVQCPFCGEWFDV